MAMACVRSFAPSLSMMCLTCTLTVSSEMNSSSAIPGFDCLRRPSENLHLARGQSFIAQVLGQRAQRSRGRHVSFRRAPAGSHPELQLGAMFLRR